MDLTDRQNAYEGHHHEHQSSPHPFVLLRCDVAVSAYHQRYSYIEKVSLGPFGAAWLAPANSPACLHVTHFGTEASCSEATTDRWVRSLTSVDRETSITLR